MATQQLAEPRYGPRPNQSQTVQLRRLRTRLLLAVFADTVIVTRVQTLPLGTAMTALATAMLVTAAYLAF